MDTIALKTAIQQELPAMFQNDPALRQLVLDVSSPSKNDPKGFQKPFGSLPF